MRLFAPVLLWHCAALRAPVSALRPQQRSQQRRRSTPAVAPKKPDWKPTVLDADEDGAPVVLHRCADLVVVDKPAGWLTHADGGGGAGRPSCAGFVKDLARPTTRSGEVGVHQRLDVDCARGVASLDGR